jgi:thiamine-monophosphate kinase
MELSDVVASDLQRMCPSSVLKAEIEEPPRYPRATLEQALHGGEDYELLFTAAPRVAVPADFEGLPLTRIGIMRKGRKGAVQFRGAPLEPLGYDHFRNDHFRKP